MKRLAPLVLVALSSVGCSESAPPGGASAKASATTAAAPPPTTAASAPTPPASAALPPRSDCPKDSTGPGTLAQPCLAKGASRMMEAKLTKIDDKGPNFNIVNKSPSPILYGKIAVFFYDKAGKQLEAKEGDKPAPFKSCAGGNLFQGVMKKDEKAVLTFSCVKKADIPEGAVTIEAELVTVGFADASEKKSEFYWSNPDLAPAARPKGGVK